MMRDVIELAGRGKAKLFRELTRVWPKFRSPRLVLLASFLSCVSVSHESIRDKETANKSTMRNPGDDVELLL
jgi:hypothetical protein